jgi:hypothetical protein
MYGIPLEHCNKADALDSLIGIAARAVACNFASFAPPPDNLPGRGLHSSTFRLNLSAFCGIGVHTGGV